MMTAKVCFLLAGILISCYKLVPLVLTVILSGINTIHQKLNVVCCCNVYCSVINDGVDDWARWYDTEKQKLYESSIDWLSKNVLSLTVYPTIWATAVVLQPFFVQCTLFTISYIISPLSKIVRLRRLIPNNNMH